MEYKPATYFSDGVAFISGAGSGRLFAFTLERGARLTNVIGIGRATALTFARDGCVRLMLGDDDFEKLKETKSLISSTYPGARVEIASLDISDEAGVDNFFAQAVKLYGRIDFAANVASIVPSPSPTHKLTGADFDRVFKFNQRGVGPAPTCLAHVNNH